MGLKELHEQLQIVSTNKKNAEAVYYQLVGQEKMLADMIEKIKQKEQNPKT